MGLTARHCVCHADVIHLNRKKAMHFSCHFAKAIFPPPSPSLPDWVQLPTPHPAVDHLLKLEDQIIPNIYLADLSEVLQHSLDLFDCSETNFAFFIGSQEGKLDLC